MINQTNAIKVGSFDIDEWFMRARSVGYDAYLVKGAFGDTETALCIREPAAVGLSDKEDMLGELNRAVSRKWWKFEDGVISG